MESTTSILKNRSVRFGIWSCMSTGFFLMKCGTWLSRYYGPEQEDEMPEENETAEEAKKNFNYDLTSEYNVFSQQGSEMIH
jgi:hypothetical protein